LAIQCFATLDLEKAKELQTDEDLVDKYYNKHLPMLINSKTSNVHLLMRWFCDIWKE